MTASVPIAEQVVRAFRDRFGGAPTVIGRAPGRVELLGNHTDANNGLVLAAAIDRETVVLGRPIAERRAHVFACEFDQIDEWAIDDPRPAPPGSWARYVRGVPRALADWYGPPASGFEAAIVGNVPIGAGLSSSASLEAALALCAIGSGLWRIGGKAEPGRGGNDCVSLADAERFELARTLRRAENDYVGVASGLLDQFCALFGRRDHALRLDCLDHRYERLPLGEPAPALVVCDSGTSRQLADGMYNRRRAECERIVAAFQALGAPVSSLRDISLEQLEASWEALDPEGRRRARHVLTENERVERGTEALRAGDVAALGRLMSASHASSRDDFENSSLDLDALIDAAAESPGFLGGKLCGAGWAGCTVNLVAADQTEAFVEAVATGFERRVGRKPKVDVCRAAEGASASAWNEA